MSTSSFTGSIASSSHGHLESFEFMRRFIAETPREQVQPKRLLTGDDLIQLGLRPGPGFKEILDAAEDAQLEGSVQTHDDALRWAHDCINSLSSIKDN